MPWDKSGGQCATVGASSSPLYAVRIFEVTEGEVVATELDGTMLDLNRHIVIPALPNDPPSEARAAIIVRWNDARTEVEASKLYLDCSDQYETMWRRVFTGYAGMETPPQYGGRMAISPPGLAGGEINIGDVGKLRIKPISGAPGPADAQQIVQTSLFYSEVSTLQDGTGSTWDDGEFTFSHAVFASTGTFFWNAPAQRPNPVLDRDPEWYLQNSKLLSQPSP